MAAFLTYCAFFRAAHNLIFFFISTKTSPAYGCFGKTFISLPARLLLSHTIKELVSRGLKSRPGSLPRSTDCLSHRRMSRRRAKASLDPH